MLMLFVPLDAHAVGVFAIVSNLGSLVARFLLQPIEEIALSLFSRLGHAGSSADAAQLQQLSVLLRHMMLTVSVLGLVLISFGPNYTFLLFHLLYGAKWSQTDAPAVLSCVMRARAFSQVRRRANARGVAGGTAYTCSSLP